MKNSLAVVATLLAVLPSAPQAQTPGPVLQQVVVSGRLRFNGNLNDPALVRYILIDPGNADPVRDGFAPLERVAVLVLFIGGDGTLGLTANQVNTGSPNFLARNRNHFAAEGFVVAVVDAANDFNAHNHPLTTDPNGFVHGSGLRGHRLPGRLHGDKHLVDLAAVMGSLRARPEYAGLPIWAIGNSRGTVSAALTATLVNPPADGLVLTSSLTGPDASEDLHGVALESITAPALIVTHLDDACPITRPEDSDALRDRFSASARVHVMHVTGGSTPVSNACDPLAPHGFFGIDQKVVDAITKWIKHSEH
jgi:dienelactone hydrolase